MTTIIIKIAVSTTVTAVIIVIDIIIIVTLISIIYGHYYFNKSIHYRSPHNGKGRVNYNHIN